MDCDVSVVAEGVLKILSKRSVARTIEFSRENNTRPRCADMVPHCRDLDIHATVGTFDGGQEAHIHGRSHVTCDGLLRTVARGLNHRNGSKGPYCVLMVDRGCLVLITSRRC
ncbi:hypothetical protein BDV35DRAFT_342765 [Aspergillus flavus]|uniref:Uncharacterized protein n=1 Tax=Aspergillus flavus TaxID=5059 RepID=A0A5N6H9I8_ASPFL|nr:hypothetical protein BDV35DRAFT_342765 [Aspergillus flavus]